MLSHGSPVAAPAVPGPVTRGEAQAELDGQAALHADLLARESAQTEFIANVSHELRTPLNAMVGMCQFLLGTELSREQREFVETIRLSADIMVALVNGTLELVKAESPEAAGWLAPFDVRALLEDGVRLIAAQAAERGLAVGFTIDDTVPLRLVGNAQRLRQILVNLLANAVKFTDRGRVDVSVGTRGAAGTGAEIEVTVRDTGIGIPPDRLGQVFAAFSQVDVPSRPQTQGTGLGLTISRGLVMSLGGQIWAESREGEGSAFHFTFPAVGAPAQATVSPAAVLLVEAEATDLGDAMRGWGLDPVVVDTAAKARRMMADGRRFAAVLVTNEGPGLAVRELADDLRADEATAGVPLVLLHHPTSVPTDDDAFDAVLGVPVDHAALREALSRLLDTGEHGLRSSDGGPDGTMGARLPLRILVVEDNPVNQRVAYLMLESLGYEADLVADGREAVEAASVHTYDVVLMDVVLPGLDGYEATAEIQRRLGTCAPKVIALTARDSDEERTRCREAGMDGYLGKPITVDKLAGVLMRLSEDAPPEMSWPAAARLFDPSAGQNGGAIGDIGLYQG